MPLENTYKPNPLKVIQDLYKLMKESKPVEDLSLTGFEAKEIKTKYLHIKNDFETMAKSLAIDFVKHVKENSDLYPYYQPKIGSFMKAVLKPSKNALRVQYDVIAGDQNMVSNILVPYTFIMDQETHIKIRNEELREKEKIARLDEIDNLEKELIRITARIKKLKAV